MPVEKTVSEIQTLEVGINGPDKANRMYITTGRLAVNLNAQDNYGGEGVIKKETYTSLLEPKFDREQFHRAVVTASITGFIHAFRSEQPAFGQWEIEEAQADWDDESGKVQFRVSAMARTAGIGSRVTITHISFQVTTLASV